MLDMVHDLRLPDSAVPSAALTLVLIPAQDSRSFFCPFFRVVIEHVSLQPRLLPYASYILPCICRAEVPLLIIIALLFVLCLRFYFFAKKLLLPK